MPGKLVVGADRGIAHAMARHLHERGDDVVAACLGDGADLAELGITVEQRSVGLDWLVHVAGIMGLDTLDSVDLDDVRRHSRSTRSVRCAWSGRCAGCSSTAPRSGS